MRGLVYMASRDKVDVDMFHKGIQYALERLGKSKFGFESTTASNFKAKATKALGTSLLIIPELRVLVLTKRHVGSGNEIAVGASLKGQSHELRMRDFLPFGATFGALTQSFSTPELLSFIT